jgi:hypothetical protein
MEDKFSIMKDEPFPIVTININRKGCTTLVISSQQIHGFVSNLVERWGCYVFTAQLKIGSLLTRPEREYTITHIPECYKLSFSPVSQRDIYECYFNTVDRLVFYLLGDMIDPY